MRGSLLSGVGSGGPLHQPSSGRIVAEQSADCELDGLKGFRAYDLLAIGSHVG